MNDINALEAQYKQHGLEDYFHRAKQYAKNAIIMHPEICDESEIAIGQSKIGGNPDLPKGTEWFNAEVVDTPLTFICQINLPEITKFDTDNKLPESGMLYLFYDCDLDGMPWGYDPTDGYGKKVFFYDGDMSLLERTAPPENIEDHGGVFRSMRLSFESRTELPDISSSVGEKIEMSREELDRFIEMMDDCGPSTISKLLGHSNNIQGSMEDECELVTNGLYCGDPSGYEEGRRTGIINNTDHWNLLLQIDSCDDIGMYWGDCGRLYLWITDEALAARDFESSWLILQCG